MRIHTIRIPSLDLGASEGFYSRLFGSGKTFGDETQGYIGFVLENVSVLLEPVESEEFEGGRYLGFSFEVPDIFSFYNHFKDGLHFTGPPKKQAWGGIMTHVTDTSENTLSIVEITADV
jgi:predicted enzyme related to lactoylglutathione lyase